MNRKMCVLTALLVFSLNFLGAFEAGDWLVRLRGIGVIPLDSSNSLSTVPHSGVNVSNSGTAELDFTYMCTDNIGVELILATTKHNIKGRKALSGIKVGSTWVLPPALTLQYHFCPESCLQPYLGIGVNYSVFYKEHSSLQDSRLSLSNSWGFVSQAGLDYLINDCWFVNFDFKFITMETRARLKGATSGHVNVRINPIIVGGGIGYRF